MCGCSRNCKAHGNLGKASVMIAELDEFADNELLTRFVGTLFDSLLKLGGRRIPLQDTCILAVNPFCILVKRICHIAV